MRSETQSIGHRLASRLQWHPLAVGAALSTLLVACYGLFLAIIGRLPGSRGGAALSSEDIGLTICMSIALGYLIAAQALLIRAAKNTLRELSPSLELTPEEITGHTERVGFYPKLSYRLTGVCGIALAIVIPVLVDPGEDVYGTSTILPEVVWHRVLGPALLWLLFRFFFAVITESRRLSSLARDHARIELTETRPLSALTRFGLGNALLAMGLLSVLALFLVNIDVAPHFAKVIGPGLVAAVALGAAGLLLPASGLRHAIAAAKHRELAWCNERIVALRDQLKDASNSDDAGRLADLAAYRQLVESVHEWPFDTSTLARFALYLIIPVGSWLGGALVERIVDSLLD